jgi:predicted enzyme related to lactoylglutathione lyase
MPSVCVGVAGQVGGHRDILAPGSPGASRSRDPERSPCPPAPLDVGGHGGGYCRVATTKKVLAGITVDCRDAQHLSAFWSQLLDKPTWVDADLPGWFRIGPTVAGGPVINFQPVPEEKSGKARIHLDLWVDDLGGAVEQVRALGGQELGEVHAYDSGTVVVMADPEGNEFCIVGAQPTTDP